MFYLEMKRQLFFLAFLAGQLTAQEPPAILEIDVEKEAFYHYDTVDMAKLATDTNLTTAADHRNFALHVVIGDVVSINGKPAKGTFASRLTQLVLRPNPAPGEAIADTLRQHMLDGTWELLQSDGTPVGTINVHGLGGGAPPPGAPLQSTMYNFAVIGGTGAFLGIRGQVTFQAQTAALRSPSVIEDPSVRRQYSGRSGRFVFHLLPISRPEVIRMGGAPALFHAIDFRPVTTSNPASAGEVLMLMATGLGPTRPGVDPGEPFTTEPLQQVNSPIEVLVNGRPAEVINKVGWPGLVDTYRIDFRVPPVTAPGSAMIRLTAAWIPGSDTAIWIH